MLDSSCSETPKTKKKTAQNRPVQRFWPDSIASGAAQPTSGDLAMSEGTGRPRAHAVTLQGGDETSARKAAIDRCAWERREREVCAVAWFCI